MAIVVIVMLMRVTTSAIVIVRFYHQVGKPSSQRLRIKHTMSTLFMVQLGSSEAIQDGSKCIVIKKKRIYYVHPKFGTSWFCPALFLSEREVSFDEDAGNDNISLDESYVGVDLSTT